MVFTALLSCSGVGKVVRLIGSFSLSQRHSPEITRFGRRPYIHLSFFWHDKISPRAVVLRKVISHKRKDLLDLRWTN